jgi:membrane-bound serine protease (ClpP class)
VLEDLLSPTLVFVLFYAGLMLIGIEFVSPGITIPGVAGAIALVTAFIGFGTLPVRIGGVVLLLVSVAFFFLEANSPGVGLLAVGAVASLVMGGYLLIDPTATDEEGVSPWAIAPIALAAVAFFVFVVPAALKAQRAPSQLAGDHIVGAEGIAETDLNPSGVVMVHAETWSATASSPITRGDRIRVTGTSGLRLDVERLESESTTEPARRPTEEPQGG